MVLGELRKVYVPAAKFLGCKCVSGRVKDIEFSRRLWESRVKVMYFSERLKGQGNVSCGIFLRCFQVRHAEHVQLKSA